MEGIPPGSIRAVRRRYDRLAGVYDRRWAFYVEASVHETLRRVSLRDGEAILDVGCGTGALLAAAARRAPASRLAGVDLSPAMLVVARKRLESRAALVAADAARLPFADRGFDLVVSTSALHYWPDPGACMAEIARVLRPGGRVAITDWCDDYLACRVADFLLRILEPAHHRTYGTDDLERMLRAAGLGAIRVERYKIDWLWGLMTATASMSSGPVPSDPVTPPTAPGATP
ncbi:MAG TPA: methyltransferase domain-containing protein [Gemmatimonadota bacterium]|nr:methyltransferase domain-containing protein [Gemmatimonadota bacterium]